MSEDWPYSPVKLLMVSKRCISNNLLIFTIILRTETCQSNLGVCLSIIVSVSPLLLLHPLVFPLHVIFRVLLSLAGTTRILRLIHENQINSKRLLVTSMLVNFLTFQVFQSSKKMRHVTIYSLIFIVISNVTHLNKS